MNLKAPDCFWIGARMCFHHMKHPGPCLATRNGAVCGDCHAPNSRGGCLNLGRVIFELRRLAFNGGWLEPFLLSVGTSRNWSFLQKFPKLRYYMVLVREACLDQKPWLFVVLASCKQLLLRLDAEVSRQIIVKHQVAALNLGGSGDEYLSKWRGACHSWWFLGWV